MEFCLLISNTFYKKKKVPGYSLAHETKIINENTNEVVAIIPPQINKATQLTLHAGLGATVAAVSNTDILAGATSGVVGEATSNLLSTNTDLTKKQIIESSKIAGAIASVAIAGPDDADSVFTGSQIARNASENNDLAVFAIPEGAARNGHLGAMITDEKKQWYQFDYFVPERVIEEAGGFNVFRATIVGYDGEASLSRKTSSDEFNTYKETLINNPNVVYIHTTPEQDTKIFNAAVDMYFNGGTYKLCTNNCVDAVQNILNAGGVSTPIDFDPRPNQYFEKLKIYYPNNSTNIGYD